MDTFFTTRINMAGWFFMAVVLGSLWHRQTDQWINLTALIKGGGGTIALAFIGAIVGIGAPPAIGFLMERITSTILIKFKRNMWNYPCTSVFRETLREELKIDSA